MSISSMTGFSQKFGEKTFGDKIISWTIEIKSVNGKSIDQKLRSPSWLGDISMQSKNILSKFFSRGSFNINIDINSSFSEQTAKINDDILKQLTNKAIELYQNNPQNLEKPKASDLLAIKGVIEFDDNKLEEQEISQLQQHILADFEDACNQLEISRNKEGQKIKAALEDILQKIQETTLEIEKISETLPEKIKEKINQQIKNLLDSNVEISEDRLAQEIIFLISKADIKEEIDRLKLHLKTADELLQSNDPVGRKLDFLCQELNREANTTCSKSIDIRITNFGMELKTYIEQFREQVQNIE